MGAFDDGYEQAIIDASREPAARSPVGFLEAFHASYDLTRQEELSISERQNFLGKVKARNDLVQKYTGRAPSVTINEGDLLQPGTLSTTVELARRGYNDQVRDLSARYPDIKSDGDLLLEIKEDSRRLREKADGVLSNTTWAGKVGSFTGAMAASMTDPLVLATLPLGASSGAGILRTALVNAGMAAGTEALIQPFVYHYKKELDSPYSPTEALERIAGAGLGAGVLSGLFKGAELGYRALRKPRIHGVDDLIEAFERNVGEPSAIERDAAHVLGDYADVLRETPFSLSDPAAMERHVAATAKALGDLEAGNPVDVQEFTRGIEPRDDVRAKIVTVNEPRQVSATENQSLAQFVKNSGGVSIEKSGGLRGEYDALFESGGSKSGAVKRRAGKSADEMAELAHESGFIDVPDPAVLAERLRDDLSGNKVYSVQGDRFERRLDLQIDREFQRWAELEEGRYHDELTARARDILSKEDVMIPTGELTEVNGRLVAQSRSAREMLLEVEQDLKAADILQKCLMGAAQ